MSDPIVPARPVLQGEAERSVSLREFEQRLQVMEMRFADQIRFARELVETRSEALDKALELQAEEYKRRLDELNHSHANALENWRQSLPREMFEAFVGQWQKWRDDVNTAMTRLSQLPTEVTGLDARLKLKETTSAATTAAISSMPAAIASIETRLKTTETALQQAAGALVLIRFMGFAGVVALIVTFLRMAKLIP